MDIAQAKQAVSDLRASRPEFEGPDEARAKTLLDQPDKVNQGFYGTCGLTAIVRSYLQYDRDRFVELLRAVYSGTDFNGITSGPQVLLQHRLEQRDAKAAAQPQGGYVPLFNLDFVLARALGKLLKIRSPKMYEAQTLVSEEIARLFNAKEPFLDAFTLDPEHIPTLNAAKLSPDLEFELKIKGWRLGQVAGFVVDASTAQIIPTVPNSEWQLKFQAGGRERVLRIQDTKKGALQVAVDVRNSESAFRDQGDLGLDSDGLKSIMQNVAGAANVTVTRVKAATPQAAVDAVNTELGRAKPYVYAFVRSFDDWASAANDATKRSFAKAATAPAPIWGRVEPEGEHIIAIDGPIRKESGAYVLPVWTWGSAYEVRVQEAYLAGYLPVLVHGQISA
ncbi:hypothetical protein [Streptomyces sp. CRN 30]|uniref:hypothetical protein n=1 Tax=Streptomyces sp. CRN 30 TaxID=3075613 RepID=UPI002A7EE2CF|nr:hypothetical protein [Streptomyces sp. CRN 30]